MLNIKKGISLIILLVTISVMIILANTVNFSLQNENTIKNATEVTELTNFSRYKEELSVSVLDILSKNPDLEKEDINETKTDEIKNYIPSLKPIDEEKFEIRKGELILKTK